jgi:predicted adenylyl cyclase CyaB
MENIETEVRSFITMEQYGRLLKFFRENATHVKEDYQETYYFDSNSDLRIQKNNRGAKLWLKGGKLHEDSREEIEVFFSKEDFPKLERFLNLLGFGTGIKWFRLRQQFDWNGIKVCLDDTKGYGLIIELERMCSGEKAEETAALLKGKMKELGIEITPKEEFERKFEHYTKNWRALTA